MQPGGRGRSRGDGTRGWEVGAEVTTGGEERDAGEAGEEEAGGGGEGEGGSGVGGRERGGWWRVTEAGEGEGRGG